MGSLTGSTKQVRTTHQTSHRLTDGRGVLAISAARDSASASRRAAAKALALKAKERLRALLNTRPLQIEREGTDRYGRTLARVYAGGINVGQTLLAEGYVLHTNRARRRRKRVSRCGAARRRGCPIDCTPPEVSVHLQWCAKSSRVWTALPKSLSDTEGGPGMVYWFHTRSLTVSPQDAP